MSKQLKSMNSRLKASKQDAINTSEKTGRKTKALAAESVKLVGNAVRFGGAVVAAFFRGVRS